MSQLRQLLRKRDKNAITHRMEILKRAGTVAASAPIIVDRKTMSKADAVTGIIGKSFTYFVGFDPSKNLTIEKGEKRLVTGIATNESVDAHGDIVRYQAVKNAMGAYMQFGNIREMHGPSAAGTVKEYDLDDDKKCLTITAKIVDDNAWNKVVEGVYKGFSIGGRIVKAEPLEMEVEDENGNIVRVWTGGLEILEIELIEISLVDRPANPDALISAYKSAHSEFIPDMAFMPVVSKSETLSPNKATFLSSFSPSIMNEKLFSKVWDQVKTFFKSEDNGNVDLDAIENDETPVTVTKSEIATLVKSFVSQAVDEMVKSDGAQAPAGDAQATVTAQADTTTADTTAGEDVTKAKGSDKEDPKMKDKEPKKSEDESDTEKKKKEEETKKSDESEVVKALTSQVESLTKMVTDLVKEVKDSRAENEATVSKVMQLSGVSTQKDSVTKANTNRKGSPLAGLL